MSTVRTRGRRCLFNKLEDAAHSLRTVNVLSRLILAKSGFKHCCKQSRVAWEEECSFTFHRFTFCEISCLRVYLAKHSFFCVGFPMESCAPHTCLLPRDGVSWQEFFHTTSSYELRVAAKGSENHWSSSNIDPRQGVERGVCIAKEGICTNWPASLSLPGA